MVIRMTGNPHFLTKEWGFVFGGWEKKNSLWGKNGFDRYLFVERLQKTGQVWDVALEPEHITSCDKFENQACSQFVTLQGGQKGFKIPSVLLITLERSR